MKETQITLLQLSFGNNIPKTIEYIKDTGIETIIIENKSIKADDFCNNINNYYQLTH